MQSRCYPKIPVNKVSQDSKYLFFVCLFLSYRKLEKITFKSRSCTLGFQSLFLGIQNRGGSLDQYHLTLKCIPDGFRNTMKQIQKKSGSYS